PDRTIAVLDLVAVRVEADQLSGWGAAPAQVCPCLGIPQPGRARTQRHVERRRSRLTALRDDLDHAIRCFRAVQRSGGGSLDDLDSANVVRVPIVRTTDRGAAALPGSAPRVAV